uniref:Uncharacterized protein n=1 Tax=Setaria viridis TaxID=4556 RepID=A0A4U6SR51_SETVI|nr:hypothetical protein SEVIR_9G031550v2 [Setaria viridis]
MDGRAALCVHRKLCAARSISPSLSSPGRWPLFRPAGGLHCTASDGASEFDRRMDQLLVRSCFFPFFHIVLGGPLFLCVSAVCRRPEEEVSFCCRHPVLSFCSRPGRASVLRALAAATVLKFPSHEANAMQSKVLNKRRRKMWREPGQGAPFRRPARRGVANRPEPPLVFIVRCLPKPSANHVNDQTAADA